MKGLERTDLVTVRGRVTHDTGSAIVMVADGKTVMLTRSLVVVNADGSVTMPQRLARDKGLI